MFVRDGLKTKLSQEHAAQRVGRELQCLLCGITVCSAVNVCNAPGDDSSDSGFPPRVGVHTNGTARARRPSGAPRQIGPSAACAA